MSQINMRQFIIALGDHFTNYKLGPRVNLPQIRSLARVIDKAGLSLSQVDYKESCKPYSVNPSLRNVPEKKIPDLGLGNFVAPNSTIIGGVRLSKNSSVWYGAVLRGDLQDIEVGEHSVIQDNVVIKRESGTGPIKIGKHVLISPNARVGGCIIQDYALIGMGSTLEDGSTVEAYGVLAAGAHLPKGTTVRSGQIFAGNPAQYLRDVTSEEREAIHENINEMRNLASIHSEETEKTAEQVFTDDVLRERLLHMSHAESLWERFQKIGYMHHPIDAEQMEHVVGVQYHVMHEREPTQLGGKDWRPFGEDSAVYPQGWKVYGEDMERYERAKKLFDEPGQTRDDLTVMKKGTSAPWTRRY